MPRLIAENELEEIIASPSERAFEIMRTDRPSLVAIGYSTEEAAEENYLEYSPLRNYAGIREIEIIDPYNFDGEGWVYNLDKKGKGGKKSGFSESKIVRDKRGRFARKEGGGSSTAKTKTGTPKRINKSTNIAQLKAVADELGIKEPAKYKNRRSSWHEVIRANPEGAKRLSASLGGSASAKTATTGTKTKSTTKKASTGQTPAKAKSTTAKKSTAKKKPSLTDVRSKLFPNTEELGTSGMISRAKELANTKTPQELKRMANFANRKLELADSGTVAQRLKAQEEVAVIEGAIRRQEKGTTNPGKKQPRNKRQEKTTNRKSKSSWEKQKEESSGLNALGNQKSIPGGSYENNGKKITISEQTQSGKQDIKIQGVPEHYTKDVHRGQVRVLVDHFTSPVKGDSKELGAKGFAMRSRPPIKNEADFRKEFDEALSNYEGKEMPLIHKIRRSLGDRISREDFDRYLLKLSQEGKVRLSAGENQGIKGIADMRDALNLRSIGVRTNVTRVEGETISGKAKKTSQRKTKGATKQKTAKKEPAKKTSKPTELSWEKQKKESSGLTELGSPKSIPGGTYENNGKKIRISEQNDSGYQKIKVDGVPEIYTKDTHRNEVKSVVDHYTSPMQGSESNLGTANFKMRSRPPIKTEGEFRKEFEEAFSNYEKAGDDFPPIYKLRRSLGDRISREKFDEYFFNMVGEGKFIPQAGSIGSGNTSPQDQVRDSIRTELDGLRAYVGRD